MVILYHFMAFLALHLPVRVALFLCDNLAFLDYLLTKNLRVSIRANFEVVLKQEKSKEAVEPLVREAYRNFAHYLYEFFLIPKIDRSFIAKHLKVSCLEHLNTAFRKGRGVISLTGHLGNWELAGIFTSLLGYRVSTVALPHKSPALTRFFWKRRGMKGVQAIPVGSQTKKLISALKRNELVALLADRTFGSAALKIDFFGRPALLPAGPAELSVKLGSPIVPGFLTRTDNGYLLSFAPPLEANPQLPEKEAVVDLAQRAIAYLEHHIRTNLSQWLVFDYVWK